MLTVVFTLKNRDTKHVITILTVACLKKKSNECPNHHHVDYTATYISENLTRNLPENVVM